jgi:hypothetical protein
MERYKFIYMKKKMKNVKVLNYKENSEIYGYIVYIRRNSCIWFFLSLVPCFPICMKEQCIIFQEPIYDPNFAPFEKLKKKKFI